MGYCRKPPKAFLAWLKFKKVLRSEATKFIKAKRRSSGVNTDDLTVAITVYRKFLSGEEPASLLAEYGPKSRSVAQAVSEDLASGCLDFLRLRKLIADQLGENTVDAPPSGRRQLRHLSFPGSTFCGMLNTLSLPPVTISRFSSVRARA